MTTTGLILGVSATLFTLGLLGIAAYEYRDKNREKARVNRERKGGVR